jgi:rhodanese-related sulfurtransferase
MHQFFEFAVRHWDLFLSLIIIIGLMFGGGLMRRISGYAETDPAGAVLKINHEDALVVDVREDNEYKEGHILAARHIPLGSLDKRLTELDAYKEKPVIVYCRSGQRSARACGILRRAGFQNVTNLKGGIMAWQSSKLPLDQKGNGKKRKGK